MHDFANSALLQFNVLLQCSTGKWSSRALSCRRPQLSGPAKEREGGVGGCGGIDSPVVTQHHSQHQ